ncbi:MAG: YeeE/YedE thiosulfate transporter family protein [Bacteroidota bacterium]
MELIYAPWPWYVAGIAIASVMFLLLYFGGFFGVSSNLRTMCTIAGGDRYADFFKIDWKAQRWNLVFVLGAVIGGFLTANYLSSGGSIELNPNTVESLEALGFASVGGQYLPNEIFGMEALLSLKGILILLGGGFLVGFGTRYAGGCTSGHAISGLSNLQLPSLLAVVGFFIGGLLMTHLLIPIIF